MSLQQLLDGELMAVLAGRDLDAFGYFNIYPSDNKLYISCGGGMQYRVDNVDTTASSAVYSELTIEKLNEATYYLNSVYVRTSDVEVFPQLPLVQTGANARMGELSFRGGITAQELIDGEYVFLLDNNGNPTAAELQQGSGAAKVDFYLNENVVINGTIRDGEILHLVATSEGGPSLLNIGKSINGIAAIPELPINKTTNTSSYIVFNRSFNDNYAFERGVNIKLKNLTTEEINRADIAIQGDDMFIMDIFTHNKQFKVEGQGKVWFITALDSTFENLELYQIEYK